MKLISLTMYCFTLVTSFLTAESLKDPISSLNRFPFTLEKGDHHRGPRGYRGHRGHKGDKGHKGHKGDKGDKGDGVAPAYIGRYYSNGVFDISAPNTIIPLGNLDGGVTPVLLQYVDPTPLIPTADRYVQVLPGGAGTYLLQYSILASLPSPEIPFIGPLTLQLQIDHGSGYDLSMPQDLFEPYTQASLLFPDFFFSGAVEVIVSLQDNDKIHLAMIEAAAGVTIGGGLPPPPRNVCFTMHRINS